MPPVVEPLTVSPGLLQVATIETTAVGGTVGAAATPIVGGTVTETGGVVTIEGASLVIESMITEEVSVGDGVAVLIGVDDGTSLDDPPAFETDDDDEAAAASRSSLLFLPTTTPTITAATIKRMTRRPINTLVFIPEHWFVPRLGVPSWSASSLDDISCECEFECDPIVQFFPTQLSKYCGS
jgi:hypothetical protein